MTNRYIPKETVVPKIVEDAAAARFPDPGNHSSSIEMQRACFIFGSLWVLNTFFGQGYKEWDISEDKSNQGAADERSVATMPNRRK